LATYTGTDRQQKLEAGAKAEGALTIYTAQILESMQELVKGFNAKYPDIKADIFRADGGGVLQRTVTEYQGGKYLVDAFEASDGNLRVLKDQQMIQPFKSPEAANYPTEVIQPDGYWVTPVSGLLGIGYNTAKVNAADVPKTYDDLLDPKWKGRMVLAGSNTGVRWMGMMLRTKGPEWVAKLKEQSFRSMNVSGKALEQLVVSGEVEISPTIFESHVRDTLGKTPQAPERWVPLDPALDTPRSVGVAAKPPHPNAALLFADFLLSEDGQSIYKRLQYTSSHKKLAESGPRPTAYQLDSQVDDFEKAYAEWQKIYNDTFVTVKPAGS
jgi:iron(III) transport system substrate-binding protein